MIILVLTSTCGATEMTTAPMEVTKLNAVRLAIDIKYKMI